MPINYIPNDPSADPAAPAMRVQAKRPNRPAGRAGFTFSNQAPENQHAPGTPEFLFWQCREGALAAVEAWESVAGDLNAWQGNRKKLLLLQDNGEDLNAFYDRSSFSFFHLPIRQKTFFSGASTDVVAHEIGHGLLDAIRPDLWDATFLETGAFHEAFGDCIAVLAALHDRDTRRSCWRRQRHSRRRTSSSRRPRTCRPGSASSPPRTTPRSRVTPSTRSNSRFPRPCRTTAGRER